MEVTISHFEFTAGVAEQLVVITGAGAGRVAAALFGRRPAPGRLQYLAWAQGAPVAAACWFPPDRLEIRIPSQAPWPAELAARLARLAGPGPPADASRAGRAMRAFEAVSRGPAPFTSAVQAAIRRVEAWDSSDADSGAGAEELARDLAALPRAAPTEAAAKEVEAARDALDDGLPADAVIGSLYRALSAAGGPPGRYRPGVRSSPGAGPSGRRSPKRGRSP